MTPFRKVQLMDICAHDLLRSLAIALNSANNGAEPSKYFFIVKDFGKLGMLEGSSKLYFPAKMPARNIGQGQMQQFNRRAITN